jgi:hypothetical protein
MNRKSSRSIRNRQHERFDTDYLSVSALLKDVKQPTKVMNPRQVIVNKALAMTHKTLTNGKEFRQLQSVIRQVYKLQENLPFVKEAQPYMLVVAPKGFLSHINRLITSCNDYIDETVLLRLDKRIQKMDYIDSFDMEGILFYDKHGNHSNYTKEEDMIEYITPQVEEQAVTPRKTHQLEDIL